MTDGARGSAGGPVSDVPPPGYRRCVGILLFDPAGHAFVAQRIDTAGPAWQMPQGGIDAAETPRAAALRELDEEIGTRDAEIVGETRGWIRYDLPPELRGGAWQGRYLGQAQKWFAARFLGRDEDISLDTTHPEFSAWRWVELEALPGLIVPFKRAVYEAVVAELGPVVRRTVGRNSQA
jgi:putative (di)nucleoside polyphosphate hydrolase